MLEVRLRIRTVAVSTLAMAMSLTFATVLLAGCETGAHEQGACELAASV